MNLVFSGTRRVEHTGMIQDAVDASGFTGFQQIVHGGASGVDAAAGKWYAHEHSVLVIPAPWDAWEQSGAPSKRGAGPTRNFWMLWTALHNGGAKLIAIPDEQSRGTWDAVNKAKALGIETFVYPVKLADWSKS